MDRLNPRILIATGQASDAEALSRQVSEVFDEVRTSVHAEHAAADFERHRPQVLVLGFKSIEEAEHYYLGLYRHTAAVQAQPHRTIVLCDKDELNKAYTRCRSDDFDDYVLFWPMAHDSRRLLMAIHVAARSLGDEARLGNLAQLAAQARRIAELETLLAQQVEQGQALARQSDLSLRDAERRLGVALEGFGQRIVDDGLDHAVEVREPGRVQAALRHLGEDAVLPPLRRAVQSLQPVRQWIDELGTQLAGPLQAAQEVAASVHQRPPRVLVVDDDPFLQKVAAGVLRGGGYEACAAAGALEAITLLRRERPALVLMDVRLPDTDGIELTRQIHATEAYRDIPIIMLTGQSERAVIVQSLEAGAVDFVVKPPEREVLLKKLARYIGRSAAPA